MARSYRHQPVLKSTNGQKDWKQSYNRRHRHRNKMRVSQGLDPLDLYEFADIWDSPGDGGYSDWLMDSERKKKSPWHERLLEEERYGKRRVKWRRVMTKK